MANITVLRQKAESVQPLTVTLTTFAKLDPAASRIVAAFWHIECVFSVTVPFVMTILSPSKVAGIWPDTKMNPLALMAWDFGISTSGMIILLIF